MKNWEKIFFKCTNCVRNWLNKLWLMHKQLQGSHFSHCILETLLLLPSVCRASLEAWRPNFMDDFREKPRELTKESR